MKNEPLVSVIINCYNGEKYLKKSIESVFSQKYKNWELIFWDNQSTDNSKEIFNSFNDNRLKYFKSKKYLKLYEARNEAIKVCSGEFISFLDSDDWWTPDKLKEQVPYFEDPKVGLVYSNFYFYYEKSKRKKSYKKKIFSGNIKKYLLNNFYIGILTSLIRKDAYYSVNGFDKSYEIIGDFDLNVKLSDNWLFYGINKYLAFYRIHGQNLSLKKRDLEILEMEKWLVSKNSTENIDLSNIENYVNYLKFFDILQKGRRYDAFRKILKLKNNFLKLKSILLLFLPISLIEKIKS